MTPPCHSFPASELPLRIQVDPHGRRRKHDPSTTTHKVDLSACELLQMLQYKCHVQTPLSGNGVVRCFPVERLFRRCKDRKGTFMVETTAWEARSGDVSEGGRALKDDGKKGARPYQWSTSWVDGDAAR